MKTNYEFLNKVEEMIKGFQKGEKKSTIEMCELITQIIERNVRPLKEIFYLSDYDFEDIQQDIYLACIQRAKTIDYSIESNIKFFKYQLLGKCITMFRTSICDTYDLTHGQYELFVKISKFIVEYVNIANEEPYDQTIKIVLKLDDQDMERFKFICNKITSECPYENLREWEVTMSDDDMFESVLTTCQHISLMTLLDTLTPMERTVLIDRFGLDGTGNKTLQIVADRCGRNKERIRQIEAKAIRKLRHPSRSRQLKDYLY